MKFRDWNTDLSKLQWKMIDYDTQADTFIEWCFEQKCFGLAQGSEIVNEWRARKQEYKSYLQITIFDFQHYSQHDVTHSINILNSIEMLVGRNRIKLLSASDLWLLLEAAYFHDIGMALTYEEMTEIWKSEEFHTYLEETLEGNDIDLRGAVNYYRQMNNLLEGRRQLAGLEKVEKLEFPEEWPLEFQRNIMIIMAAYVRKKHPGRSRRFMERRTEKARRAGRMSIIKERMDLLIAEISELHGDNYQDIEKKVFNHAVGFGVDSIHPQFVAVLLRLGDLLDMDNNRFNVRAIEHFGELPVLSGYHYEKHRAIYHFSITPEQIEASACSNQYEVCREISKWFQWVKIEVENLICDWNRFAPQELKGCELQRCKLDVYFGKTEFDAKWQKSFEVDQKRLINLMTGSNIYTSKLDCLREYIQNALDASKMRLWMDLKHGRIQPREDRLEEITPFDIRPEDYEERAIEIEVTVGLDREKRNKSECSGGQVIEELEEPEETYVCIKINDHGVGMEEECIDSLAVVGRSWRGRSVYQNEILKMPEWLKPTGGFGIGMQSAFMLTRQVKIYTRSIQETDGYVVKLSSPKEGGSIVKIRKNKYRAGTEISFHIPLNEFYELIKEASWPGLTKYIQEKKKLISITDTDVFSQENNEDYIKDFLGYYVAKRIVNPLFPIRVKGGRKEMIEYSSPYASDESGFRSLNNQFWLQERYLCSISENLAARIWDKEKNVFVYVSEEFSNPIHFDLEEGRRKNHFCYKGVKVWDIKENERNLEYYYFLSVCVDMMGGKMEEVLSVRRNDFAQNFSIEKYYREYLAVYVEAVYQEIRQNPKWKNKEKINRELHVFLFLILAIQILEKEKLNEVLSFFKTKIVEPQTVYIKKVTKNGMTLESKKTEEILEELEKLFTKDVNYVGDGSIFVVAEQPFEAEDIPVVCLKTSSFYPDLPENRAYARNFVNKLYKKGVIYSHPDICHALLNLGKRFHIEYFRIEEGNVDLVYAMISGLDEDWEFQKQIYVEKEVFVRKAFWVDDHKRYIAENINCKQYNDLRVDKLPTEITTANGQSRRKTYLISPISYGAYINLLRRMNLDRKQLDVTKKVKMDRYVKEKDFIELITDNEEFGSEYRFLISWIYKHQINEDTHKLSLEQIDQRYREMLVDIYKTNFERISGSY